MNSRREVIAFFLAAAALPGAAMAGPVRRVARRTTRRVVRRTVRRRHRRRVRRRVVAGASLLVVPTALAVGWELEVDRTVYVVKSVEPRGDTEVVVLVAANGSTLTETILREDDAENSVELEGSTLPDDDTSTPSVTVEVNVEVDD